MPAAIPYRTFPTIALGPLQLRTFGLMVGLAVLAGVWVAGSYGSRWGVSRDATLRLATRMVLVGVVAARLTWAATHRSQIQTPLDVIAVWRGGLQLSAGFVAALIVGYPTLRSWNRLLRWRVLDGYSVGLALSIAISRIGSTAVGEHFGPTTSFVLATRWEGGSPPSVREPKLGLGVDARSITDGVTFHNTAVYEFLLVIVLFVVLQWLMTRPRLAPGTVAGAFLLVYGSTRVALDSLRVNDERVAGLTGAQWMCLAVVPMAVVILTRVRRATAVLVLADAPLGTSPASPSQGDNPVAQRR